ncbi:MAG: hypothetical protein JWO40_231 [Candidatus Doudnabacteria bacterium]|nr:hypothetical protein [Candidatus Doudnabacteria bacterium]
MYGIPFLFLIIFLIVFIQAVRKKMFATTGSSIIFAFSYALPLSGAILFFLTGLGMFAKLQSKAALIGGVMYVSGIILFVISNKIKQKYSSQNANIQVQDFNLGKVLFLGALPFLVMVSIILLMLSV